MVHGADLVLTDAVPGLPGKARGHTGSCERLVVGTGLDLLLKTLAELTSALKGVLKLAQHVPFPLL